MKIRTGIDIIEVDRIKKYIEKDKEKFLNKIYTENEIKYCESKNVSKYESYAGRFAAKEAIFKAISIYFKKKSDISFKDVEIVNEKNGKPKIVFLSKNKEVKELIKKIENMDISISHLKEIAIAEVQIIIKEEE